MGIAGVRFPRARLLLNCERVREKLDGMCAEAQENCYSVGDLVG
jgi:hypothetical protein